MLKNFFKLNGEFSEFTEHCELTSHFKKSRDLRSVMFMPDSWPVELSKNSDMNFLNVSLSKTSFLKVTFLNCDFEDCLFIGCSFEDVEFHNCRFRNCNFFKANFVKCYLDPNSFEFDRHYKNTAANIMTSLYQKLLDDLSDQSQFDFAAVADINFRKWKRAQLKHDYKQNKLSYFQVVKRTAVDWLYEVTSGYGHRPARFFLSTVGLFLAISGINYLTISNQISVSGSESSASFVDTAFYTFSILTVLGFSSVMPVTSIAKVFCVVQVLLSIGWLSLFTSILVKRVHR